MDETNTADKEKEKETAEAELPAAPAEIDVETFDLRDYNDKKKWNGC